MTSRGAPRAQTRARVNSSAALPPAVRRVPSDAQVRAGYSKRLDELVDKMADAFKNTVSAAQVGDRANNSRAEFQAQVETANLAAAAEGLLALISELKTAVVVQDISASDREAKNTKKALEDDVKRGMVEVKSLRENVGVTLAALERHYYSSVPHVRARDAERGN